MVGKSYTELVTLGRGQAREVGYSKSVPGMTKERKLTNIDETKISNYLDNNVENLIHDYIQQAGGYVQRKIHLGEDLKEFGERFIVPISRDLQKKGNELTSKEIKTLEQEVDGLKSPFGSEGISEVDTRKYLSSYNWSSCWY